MQRALAFSLRPQHETCSLERVLILEAELDTGVRILLQLGKVAEQALAEESLFVVGHDEGWRRRSVRVPES